MSNITRDPETGQVKAVNGRPGKVLAWLALIQPAVLFVISVTLVPIGALHFKEHRRTDQFTTATLLRLGSLEDGQTSIKTELKEVRVEMQKAAVAIGSMDTAVQLLLAAD